MAVLSGSKRFAAKPAIPSSLLNVILLYRLKIPSRQVAGMLTALAEGLDPSVAERVLGYRQARITTRLSRAGEHAQTLHERFFCHLRLPHLQQDELRKRLRSSKHVV